jgi:predicted nucleic acid-binding protein
MIIVSDTTPFNYLVLIGQQNVLHALFGRVIIPQAVFEELQRERTPSPVREWIKQRPQWLEVQTVQGSGSPDLDNLGAGERAAILLAEEMKADPVLMDDKDGRRKAAHRQVVIIGTLGVLDRAAERGLLDLTEAITRLQMTTFRAPKDVIEAMLEQDLERRRLAE